MNILVIHQYFLEEDDPGGSRFNEFTKMWVEQGNHITVLAGMVHYATGKKRSQYKGKYIYESKNSSNVKVIRSHVSESHNVNFLGRLWSYFSFVFSSVFAGLLKAREKYDIIIVTSPPLFVGITGYLLSRIKNIPFIFEVRDLWPESAIDTGVLRNKHLINFALWFESFVYKKAALISVLTPAFREILITRKGVDRNKIIYIPNAADFSLSESLLRNFDSGEFRRKLGLDGKITVIYVGAHGVANHLIQVVETAEIMKKENVEFLLVGDGMQKKELISETEKRGLTNIRFIDSVPKTEVFKYILASDIGTSVLKKVDTFKTVYSNKTFDYMACKKPVLMVIDGVSRELVEDADCGIYVEPENSQDFAEKIRKYIKDPGLIEQHGNNGYNYARERFDRVRLAVDYIEQIRKAALKTSN